MLNLIRNVADTIRRSFVLSITFVFFLSAAPAMFLMTCVSESLAK